MLIKMKWWQSAASTITYINRNICRGINVCSCVCLSLRKVDLLIINTIWLSKHEVYLPHVHVPSLLRERERGREGGWEGERNWGQEKEYMTQEKQRRCAKMRDEWRKEREGIKDKGKQMDRVSQCCSRFNAQYVSLWQRKEEKQSCLLWDKRDDSDTLNKVKPLLNTSSFSVITQLSMLGV